MCKFGNHWFSIKSLSISEYKVSFNFSEYLNQEVTETGWSNWPEVELADGKKNSPGCCLLPFPEAQAGGGAVVGALRSMG